MINTGGSGERRLTTEYVAARALLDATSIEEAASGILQAICESLAWEHAALCSGFRRPSVGLGPRCGLIASAMKHSGDLHLTIVPVIYDVASSATYNQTSSRSRSARDERRYGTSGLLGPGCSAARLDPFSELSA